jgi:hypothetical protein
MTAIGSQRAAMFRMSLLLIPMSDLQIVLSLAFAMSTAVIVFCGEKDIEQDLRNDYEAKIAKLTRDYEAVNSTLAVTRLLTQRCIVACANLTCLTTCLAIFTAWPDVRFDPLDTTQSKRTNRSTTLH